MIIVKLLVIGVILLLTIYHLFPVIQVCGESMFPTYLDGEIIFGTRLYRKSKLKVGEVILYRSPTDTDRVVVKRISTIRKDYFGELQFYCLGDNADNSYDSRDYGYVSSKNLVCRVINQRRNENHEHDNNLCD